MRKSKRRAGLMESHVCGGRCLFVQKNLGHSFVSSEASANWRAPGVFGRPLESRRRRAPNRGVGNTRNSLAPIERHRMRAVAPQKKVGGEAAVKKRSASPSKNPHRVSPFVCRVLGAIAKLYLDFALTKDHYDGWRTRKGPVLPRAGRSYAQRARGTRDLYKGMPAVTHGGSGVSRGY